ncbi:Protein-glutamine gamma-glutamyltransferase 2, partial [Varanus komodoensis]
MIDNFKGSLRNQRQFTLSSFIQFYSHNNSPVRLKRPSSLSLASYGIPCKPATNLVALRSTDSNLAISFLYPGTQSKTLSTCRLLSSMVVLGFQLVIPQPSIDHRK